MANDEQLTASNQPAVREPRIMAPAKDQPPSASARLQIRALALISVVLLCCFARPLYELVRFAVHSDLFSHVLLIPFISGYLLWISKHSLPAPSSPARGLSLIPAATAMGCLLLAFAKAHSGSPAARQDYLSWTTLAVVLLFIAACVFTLSPQTLRAIRFPLLFLFFAVPFPVAMVDAIEGLLQHSSAAVADLFFSATGMTFLRSGLFFQLPGIQLQVAPECSGIHSTLVLFITSLVAGQLFLRSFTNRSILAFAVIPLGILRNALRIWTIGELCVHVGPHMIDSPIHRRGGPLFFVVSLAPLFLLIYLQRRRELKTKSHVI